MNSQRYMSRYLKTTTSKKMQLSIIFGLAISVLLVIVCIFATSANAKQADSDSNSDVGTTVADTSSTSPYAATSQNVPTEAEKARVKTQYEGFLANDLATFPTSFKIADTSYTGFATGFTKKSQTTEDVKSHVTGNVEGKKTTSTLTHTETGLNFIVESVLYENYAAYDWTIYVEWPETKNENSPIVSNINALDINWEGASPTLDGSIGDHSAYKPYSEALSGEITKGSNTGRGTEEDSSYFNFKYGDKGMRMAVSWPACWQMKLNNTSSASTTHMTAGQTNLNTYLKPGEKLRSPLIAFVHYDGISDDDRTTNMWRHWFIDCNMNTITDGSTTGSEKLPDPAIYGATSIQWSEMTRATDENQIEAIKYYLNNKIGLTYWWMDAGWYYTVDSEGHWKTLDKGDWSKTGTWVVDKSRFPSEFKDITNFAKAHGMRSLLWFEPERVADKSLLRDDGTTTKPEWCIGNGADNELVWYGYKDALDWSFNRIKNVMETGGIDMYREDFNYQPEVDFAANDAKLDADGKRRGISENLHCQGHIELWDRILNYFPNATIDCCASGGNRNDLGSMRRGIPLHKTDHAYGDRVWQQNVMANMQKWIPYVGTKANGETDADNNTKTANRYSLRTALAGAMVLGYDTDAKNAPIDWDIVRDITEEHKDISHFIYSDFYSLEEWSDALDTWAAWEYFEPKTQDGYIIAFRRDNAVTSKTYKPKGLQADANYKIWFEDANNVVVRTGQDLMTNGVTFNIPTMQGSDILHIALAQNAPADRSLVPTVTQVSKNGQYAGTIAEAGEAGQNSDYNRMDIRFNMNLRNTILSKDQGKVEYGVQGDYANLITIDGKTVAELNSANANNVVMNYDAFNNILNVEIVKSLFAADAKHSIKIDKSLVSGGGAKLEGEVVFNYDPNSDEWGKVVDPQPTPDPEPTPVAEDVTSTTGSTGDNTWALILAIVILATAAAYTARKSYRCK